MSIKTNLIIIIVSVVMMSCNTTKKANAQMPLLTIERAPCLGTCSVYSIELYADKTIQYSGIKHVKRIGKETLKLSSKDYKAIVQQLDKLPFSEYHTEYGKKIRDLPRIYITYKEKQIKMTQKGGPQELLNLIQTLEQNFSFLK